MKKIRIYLSVMAVLFALAGVFASSALEPQDIVYRFVENGANDFCEEEELTCQLTGNYDCQVSVGSPILGSSPIISSTSCGAPLKRTTPPPGE